ncbi:MAG: plasmid mobilization relaxosome protein MobC [Cyclobacteriaceae bacterium]
MSRSMEEKKPYKYPRGGRKKTNKDVRSLSKTIRFNEKELSTALSNCEKAGWEFSEFVRQLLLKPKIVIKQKDPIIVTKVHSQIMKIGINLNQMTRALNNQYEPHYFAEIAKKLENIESQLSSIYEEISK